MQRGGTLSESGHGVHQRRGVLIWCHPRTVGRVGTVREEVDSGELVFYDVEFGGSWERRYVREEALELEASSKSAPH